MSIGQRGITAIWQGDPLARWTEEERAMIDGPAEEGEIRFFESAGDVEQRDGEWRRILPGWYVEVYRDRRWRRELGPYPPSLDGRVPLAMIEQAEAAGLL